MNPAHAFQCDHWVPLVVLSYTISVFGAWCALQWAGQIRRASGWLLAGWVSGSAVAMGGGAIWSMHFIAMISCRLPVPVSYDVTLTLASLLVAIVVTGIGLSTVGIGAPSTGKLLAGGVFTGLGVAGMHYTGMAAMRLPARTTYAPALVAASILIAIVAATAALWMAFNVERPGRRGWSALLMGGAVCGMHYTAMAAATFLPTTSLTSHSHAALRSDELGYMVFGLTLGVLVLMSLGSRIIERHQVEEVLRRAHDELERQVAERTAELERQRAFLRQVIDINPNFVFAKDRNGRFTLVNRAVAEAYGTTVEELVGKRDADFNPNPEEVESFVATDRDVMDSMTEKRIPEERITDSRGRLLWLQTVKRPIVSKDGRADQVLGVSTDITERRALEEQLRQSQKLEAIGTLAGGVAHDFNNFLTMIIGYSDLLLGAMPPDEPLLEHVREIKVAGNRAAALTRQLLTFGRKQLAEPRILDLETVWAGMETMIRSLVGGSIELVRVTHPELGSVQADRVQMEQVLLNLVVNARDAMPMGGRLTIETRNVEVGAEDPRGLPLEPGKYVLLSVADTGQGMDGETSAHVFEPFFTTKERGRGTGLGLSTVYGIVTQSRGWVRFDTTLGSGTTFEVYLPRVEAAAEPEETAESTRPVAGTETVLVVEDEDALRRLVTVALGQQGYSVLEASNGADALRIASAGDAPIDLLLTDGVMPGLAVGELLERIRSVQPNAKVLLVSGYTGEAILRRGVLSSSMPFLAKPFTSDELLRKVRDVLDAG